MDLVRYARYVGDEANMTAYPREVALLRGHPCVWGRCTFCDYIDDNTTDDDAIQRVADETLAKITGEFSRIQIINSGSIQELPLPVRSQIRDLIRRLDIKELWAESYWSYRKHYEQTRRFFDIETHLFLGVETFDDRLRNTVLNKAMRWDSVEEVAAATDSICLMVGIVGQSQEIVRRDIGLLLEHFKHGIVNIFTENRLSQGLLDSDLIAWFREEYAWLSQEPRVDVLWQNTDFGVG